MVELNSLSSTVFRHNKICSSRRIVMTNSLTQVASYLTESVLMDPVTTIRMEMKILNWLVSVLHIVPEAMSSQIESVYRKLLHHTLIYMYITR